MPDEESTGKRIPNYPYALHVSTFCKRIPTSQSVIKALRPKFCRLYGNKSTSILLGQKDIQYSHRPSDAVSSDCFLSGSDHISISHLAPSMGHIAGSGLEYHAQIYIQTFTRIVVSMPYAFKQERKWIGSFGNKRGKYQLEAEQQHVNVFSTANGLHDLWSVFDEYSEKTQQTDLTNRPS